MEQKGAEGGEKDGTEKVHLDKFYLDNIKPISIANNLIQNIYNPYFILIDIQKKQNALPHIKIGT